MEEYGGSSMVINGEKGRGVIIRRLGVELHKWIRVVIHRIIVVTNVIFWV